MVNKSGTPTASSTPTLATISEDANIQPVTAVPSDPFSPSTLESAGFIKSKIPTAKKQKPRKSSLELLPIGLLDSSIKENENTFDGMSVSFTTQTVAQQKQQQQNEMNQTLETSLLVKPLSSVKKMNDKGILSSKWSRIPVPSSFLAPQLTGLSTNNMKNTARRSQVFSELNSNLLSPFGVANSSKPLNSPRVGLTSGSKKRMASNGSEEHNVDVTYSLVKLTNSVQHKPPARRIQVFGKHRRL
jgi:hypothetical protein